MRFMIMLRASAASEANLQPCAATLAALASFRQQLASAGVLLDAARLAPSSQGWRVRLDADLHADADGGARRHLDGPFPAGELVAGYMVIDVRTREEAIEWSRRFPKVLPGESLGEIEVRPLADAAELPATDPSAARSRPA